MSLLEPASLTEALLVAKGAAAPSRFTTTRSSAGAGAGGRARQPDGRARLPLRLDEKRHRRLRLATAHLRKSGQALLLAALDHYLDHVVPTLIEGRCHCLACGMTPPAPSPAQGPA
ncbi:MAG TPA: hypothetical protein VMU87_01695 [Stellaceae bacterium]|nr:hypothetical protein [Stellaceae bacterium]